MTHTEQETRIVATGTLSLSCPDRLTERLHNMRREGFVTYHLEGGEPGELTRIVFRNVVTGRCLDVENAGETINQTGPAGFAYWRAQFASGPVDAARRCVDDYGPALTPAERATASGILKGATVPESYGPAACRYAAAMVHVSTVEDAGCTHPPAELYSWYARHDGMPGGRVLVVTCKACGKVLQGGADLEE